MIRTWVWQLRSEELSCEGYIMLLILASNGDVCSVCFNGQAGNVDLATKYMVSALAGNTAWKELT